MLELDHKAATAACHRLIDNVSKVFLGKPEALRRTALALFANGHILLEDVPGVGKTLLAKAIAKSIDGKLKRAQFTADLLPSDITGVTVYQQSGGSFEFREGPVFANVFLADEINRATPRTQSSLLEAMEEGQVTVDGVERQLPKPFFVIATQNPIELEGTYPLPFSQMDRFIVRLRIGYLDNAGERRMLHEQKESFPLDQLGPVLGVDELLAIQRAVRQIAVAEELYGYLVDIVATTRTSQAFDYGASPRGSLDLLRYAQAMALLDGRGHVLPDDIKKAAPITLGHRVIVRKGTRLATASNDDLLDELVETVAVPV